MFKKQKKEIKYLVGDARISTKFLKPFHEIICDFLSKFSEEILNDRRTKKFPDVKTLGFWCRKKNILNLKKKFSSKELRLGLGLIFHVTPSNVPTNFAYSLIFGLLTGNSNIVKVPSKNFPQIDIICAVLKKVLKFKKYSIIKKMITIIKYSKNDEFSKKISAISDARLIWGGDETINKFKEFRTPERSKDITFSDRYSFSIINSENILKINNFEFNLLLNRFYNDTFLVDQNACSSPRLIVWTGKKINQAKLKFWKRLNEVVSKKYHLPEVAAIDKFSHLCKDVIKNKNFKKFKIFSSNIYTIQLKDLEDNSDNIKGKWGFFYEFHVNKLDYISKFINKKYQTLSYYGEKKENLKEFIIRNNILGIDRVVPIGQALEIGFHWDGYDLNSALSRIIEVK